MDQLTEDLLGRVAHVAPVIRAHAQAGEDARHLPQPIYDALIAQGLFALQAPRALGGLEVTPATACIVWEAVARIDAATGWNLAQSNAGLIQTATLPPAGHARLYGSGAPPIMAVASFPPASGRRVEGGFRVSGRLALVSGCHRADWLLLPFLNIVDGRPETDPTTGGPLARMACFPRAEVEILDSWHTLGMRGTGSTDVVLAAAFADDELIAARGKQLEPASPFAGPLYRLAHWPVVHGESAVSLGIAVAAIERLIALADRVPAMAAASLRDREIVQLNLGRAQALVDGARAYLHQTGQAAYEAVAAGGELGADHKVAMQLAACTAAEASAKAVDLMFEAAGSSSIRIEQGLERLFRDVHVLTQHTARSTARYVSAGRVMLGLAPDTPILR